MKTEITYRGYTINVVEDESAANPREDENLGILVYWHKREELGDIDGSKRYGSPIDFLAALARLELSEITDKEYSKDGHTIGEYLLIKAREENIILPVYIYQHSGTMLSTRDGYPFNDRWDGGQLGFIYMTNEQMMDNWGDEQPTDRVQRAVACLRGEVSTFNDYLNGYVYGFETMDKDGEVVDSCYGYYGADYEESGLLMEARSVIDCDISRTIQKHIGKRKKEMKAKVPLIYRKELPIKNIGYVKEA